MDSVERFETLCKETGLPEKVWDCFVERGYDTASSFALSIPDAEGLEMAIRLILRDGPSPMGNALGNPDISNGVLKIHAVAGKIRRIYAEAKTMSEPNPQASTAVALPVPPRLDWEGAPPPQISQETILVLKNIGVPITQERSWTMTACQDRVTFRPSTVCSKTATPTHMTRGQKNE